MDVKRSGCSLSSILVLGGIVQRKRPRQKGMRDDPPELNIAAGRVGAGPRCLDVVASVFPGSPAPLLSKAPPPNIRSQRETHSGGVLASSEELPEVAASGRIVCSIASRRSRTYVRYSSRNIRSVLNASTDE